MPAQYFTATSLDGFIATEDDSLDWLFPLDDVNDTGCSSFIQIASLTRGKGFAELHCRLPKGAAS